MSRPTLAARVRRDRTEYLIRYVTNRKKTFLYLALLCVIDPVDIHFGRTFSIFKIFVAYFKDKLSVKFYKENICLHYIYFLNFKPLAVFWDCTARLATDLVGNPAYLGRLISINFLKERKRICAHTKIREYWHAWFSFQYLYPRKLCLAGILFSRCPSVFLCVRPCVRPKRSISLISHGHLWNLIHICTTYTWNKKVRARG